ncbi:PAS domain-containing protein [Streptomyces collinus]|uniref:PAS domain-containing protein n=1 Tax=Streptomyces collinus TaxID=42684 RepID=UPI00364B17D5
MAGKQDAPTAVVVVDPDGMVSGWSEGGRLLLGWTAQETVGRPLAGLLIDPPPRGFPEGYGSGPDPTGFTALRHRDGSRWTPCWPLTRCSAPPGGRWDTR